MHTNLQDITRHRLFKFVGIKRDEINKRSFLNSVCQQRFWYH